MIIKQIEALQVLDSRGIPTVEATITLENGTSASAMVPSGASTGTHEALELRDGVSSYRGKTVHGAISAIEGEIQDALKGFPISNQPMIDQCMINLDGTHKKARLGANAILAVSLAAARTAAFALNKPLYHYLSEDGKYTLPLPEIQIIGGGKHGNNALDLQDIMVVCPEAESLERVFEITFDVYNAVGDILKGRNLYSGLADEGGFFPQFDSHRQAFDTVVEGIEAAGYRPGVDVLLSLDVAANNLYRDGHYYLQLEDVRYSSGEFCELVADWCKAYPIGYLEDPVHEDDWNSWSALRATLDESILLVGDDLFVTNEARIRQGIDQKAANAALIKPNQIGTLTEAMDCLRVVQEAGWQSIVSARSGETEDPFIAHLAVGTKAGMIKVGALATCARTSKWNELLRISK
ncbi:MAG: phosphopyruvate hydratase, partial [Saprospiraceae bacterium]|nr:phosphopyruvate hydratase [Saprospiraceae bacterium]